MSTIGFIGVGQIGGDIAQLAIKAGYTVVLSNSRGPESLSSIVKTLGDKAQASTSARIANDESVDILILSVPLNVISTILPILNIKNKLIIDTSNYYPFRDGQIDVLDKNELTTSEYVKQYLDPTNGYIKAFNNIDFLKLKLNATQDKSKQNILPISGDDDKDKQKAELFINKLGFKVYDAGKVKDSWRFEPKTPFYLTPYFVTPPDGYNFEQSKEYIKSTPSEIISKTRAKELLDSAIRIQDVGGSIEETDEVLKSVIFEGYVKAQEEKNLYNTASLTF